MDAFVQDEQQAETYREELERCDWGDRELIIHNQPAGPGPARSFIQRYYREGTKVVSLDDDIKGLHRKAGSGHRLIHPEDWEEMVYTGFTECEYVGTILWGIYPVLNGKFMRNRIDNRLSYIVGTCFGMITSHDPGVTITLDHDKEDYERSILVYRRYGELMRLEYFAPDTSYYTEPGGMQGRRTEASVRAGAEYLVKHYPEFCSLNLTKKSGRAEVRLRDRRRKRVWL